MWIGTRWCNYHTSAGLILECTSLQPLPQGVEWGSFFRNQAKRNSGQWAPRIWSERARATFCFQASLHSDGPNDERLGQEREVPKEKSWQNNSLGWCSPQKCIFVLELWSWLWNLKADSLPTLPLPLFLCVCFLSLFPLFTPAFSCSDRQNWYPNGKRWEGKHSPTLYWARTVMTNLDLERCSRFSESHAFR